ncbi:MAG: hypothetical protein RSD14_04910 [Clostridia bacterium]
MKWSNEELVSIYEDANCNIQCAIDDLQGVEEYKEVLQIVLQAQEMLDNLAETYETLYDEECEKQEEYENMEYEINVL